MSATPLYRRLLGDAYARLPPPVQRFHALQGVHVLTGWVRVDAPDSMPARLLALCLGTPRTAHSGPLCFELEARPEQERWTRHFPHQTMRSRMCLDSDGVEERLGPARLRFRLEASPDRLRMQLTRMRFLGVPVPAWLRPRIVAEETGASDLLHFRVEAELPWVGRVASYTGHLAVPIPKPIG